MENLYYLNRERFSTGDTTTAFQFAKNIIKSDPNIDTVTFLVYQAQQYEPFLGELGLQPRICAKHIIDKTKSGITIQVHTVKTYSPSYAFMGHDDCELLIAIGVPPKYLEQFVDKSWVKYWIIVPWLLNENQSFLAVHEAIDLETNEVFGTMLDVDARIKGAVRWLLATSYPNEGYHHPLDEDRLKQMSNALAHYKVPLDYDSVHHYCLFNGMIDSAACKTAEFFVKAQNRKFATIDNADLQFLKKMMEDSE